MSKIEYQIEYMYSTDFDKYFSSGLSLVKLSGAYKKVCIGRGRNLHGYRKAISAKGDSSCPNQLTPKFFDGFS